MLYRALLLPRLIEEKMLRLLRQGKLSKWFSGIGQEAIAVGVTAALEDRDLVLPLIVPREPSDAALAAAPRCAMSIPFRTASA